MQKGDTEHTFSKPPPGGCSGSRLGRASGKSGLLMGPANVPSAGSKSSRFPLPWIGERAQLLQQLFERVEDRLKTGVSLDKALRRRWYGKRFHTAHHIKVRLSDARLRTLFYHWRRNGRTPECLSLRFGSALPPVPPETVRKWVRSCAMLHVSHFTQALRLIDDEGISLRRLNSALPERVRRTIRETFAARRLAKIDAQKRLSGFGIQMGRLLAANAVSRRRLNKIAEGLV